MDSDHLHCMSCGLCVYTCVCVGQSVCKRIQDTKCSSVREREGVSVCVCKCVCLCVRE